MRKIIGVRGSQNDKPNELLVNIDTVYIRENIVQIEADGFKLWQYDEIQYSLIEYQQVLTEKINNIEAMQEKLTRSLSEIAKIVGYISV